MASYESHAWRDAMDIAQDLIDVTEEGGTSIADVRSRFEAMDVNAISQFERNNAEVIADYLQKSVTQRPPFLRRITKDVGVNHRCFFLTLCVIAALRTRDLLELRDRFRMVLAPGRGNRVTIASVYSFGQEVRDLFHWEWPGEVFEAMGIDDLGDGDDR
jgi:hypothetical protein